MLPSRNEAGSARGVAQAVRGLQVLEREFYNPRTGLYNVTGDKHGPNAALWPTSQVLDGAIAVAGRTHAAGDMARVRRIISSLRAYGTPSSGYRVGTNLVRRYYDDNNWIALNLLDAYSLLRDPAYLYDAKRLFDFLTTGWDARRGGIRWATDKGDRPTVSTAPAITIAFRLAKITNRSSYRAWGQRLYSWEVKAMRSPNGLFYDHYTADGKLDRDMVSYNQGVMIDANLAYAALTGDKGYVREAQRIAQAAARAFPAPRHNRSDYAVFDAIYFQALAHLDAARPGAASLTSARDFLTWAWSFDGAPRSARFRDQNGLLEQAAYVITAAAV